MAKRSPRLQFTEDERQNPVLKKAIKKADNVADKLEKAEAKIPKKTITKKERTTDPTTGKTVVRLHFEENEKKPPSKLQYAARDAPLTMLSAQFHRQMRDSDDSAATSAADASVSVAETAYHVGEAVQYSHKMKPYRTAAHAENRADKANLNALQKEAQQYGNRNPYSKYQQKKALKQEYAKAKRASSNTANASEIAAKAAKTAAEKSKQAVEFVSKNKKYVIILGAIALLLMVFMNMISSCSVLLQGAAGSLGMTTYTSTEEDMREVEAAYVVMETALQEKLDNYEILSSGYDEYHITGTVLGHDPFVLTSILTAVYGEYTPEDVEMFLHTIFSLQYRLTETVRRETRYRIVNGERVPYLYTICTITLTCTPMEELAESLLTEEQYELYEIYMTTSGNNSDLFEPVS